MQRIFDFFLDWKVKLGILAFVVLSAFAWHKVEVKQAADEAALVATLETRQRVQNYYETRIKKAKEDADKAQSDLKASFDTQAKEKDAKFKTLDSKYRTLLSGVSNRPNRPESTSSKYSLTIPPGDKESTSYVDGSGLYRIDAEFLIRYSTRTEGLKIELQSCYAQYDAAKKAIDDFQEAHKQP